MGRPSGVYIDGEAVMVGDTVECVYKYRHERPPFVVGKHYTVLKVDGDGDPICMAEPDYSGETPQYAWWFKLVRRGGQQPAIAERIEQLATGIRMTPEVKCACCHTKAPRTVVKDHPQPSNILGMGADVNQPNLTGWLLMVYPYSDPYIKQRSTGVMEARFGMAWPEVLKVCPKCAPQVMGTVKHMADGWRSR